MKKTVRIVPRKDKELMKTERGCWEQKRSIIIKKKNLMKGVLIENDLTKKERGIQQKLRKIAKDEREKEVRIKIGYKKIAVGERMFWNEKEDKLEEQRRGRREWKQECRKRREEEERKRD